MVVVSFNDMGLKSLYLTRVFSAFYFKTKMKKKGSFSLIFTLKKHSHGASCHRCNTKTIQCLTTTPDRPLQSELQDL